MRWNKHSQQGPGNALFRQAEEHALAMSGIADAGLEWDESSPDKQTKAADACLVFAYKNGL